MNAAVVKQFGKPLVFEEWDIPSSQGWPVADYRPLARRLQAGREHDTQARHLCVGRTAAGRFPCPLFDVVANCITIRGSFVGTREDMAETLAFAADGKIKADIELQPLSDINEVFDRLEHGKVAGRVVLDFLGANAGNGQSKASMTKKPEAAPLA